MQNKFYILLFAYFFSINMFADNKVLVLTTAFNRPDFIEIQAKTFKAFLRDNYEYVVMNDAPNDELSGAIEQMCEKLLIRCIRIPQNIHFINGSGVVDPPSLGVANAIQYTMKTIGIQHEGTVAIVDSDMFLIKPLNICEYLGENDIAGIKQTRLSLNPKLEITYITNQLVFMNMLKLPNKTRMSWKPGVIGDIWCDTGAHLYYYFKKNPTVKLKFFIGWTEIKSLPTDRESLYAMGYDELTINFILSLNHTDPYSMELLVDNHFLHYRAGGNWAGMPEGYHLERTQHLNTYINNLLEREEAKLASAHSVE